MPFPVSEMEIENTERVLGYRFPPLMRVRMMRENGGEFEIGGEAWWLLPFRDRSTRKTRSRTMTDILSETEELRSSGLAFPSNGAAIAHNGSGDYVVLVPDAELPDRFSTVARVWRMHGPEMSERVDLNELFGAL